jgi:hypothetical protein
VVERQLYVGSWERSEILVFVRERSMYFDREIQLVLVPFGVTVADLL